MGFAMSLGIEALTEKDIKPYTDKRYAICSAVGCLVFIPMAVLANQAEWSQQTAPWIIISTMAALCAGFCFGVSLFHEFLGGFLTEKELKRFNADIQCAITEFGERESVEKFVCDIQLQHRVPVRLEHQMLKREIANKRWQKREEERKEKRRQKTKKRKISDAQWSEWRSISEFCQCGKQSKANPEPESNA